MSLSEASKSFPPILSDLDVYLIAAMDYADNMLLDGKVEYGLTRDDIGAINLYTQGWKPAEDSLYCILNERLRAEDRSTLAPFMPYLKLILTALKKLPRKDHVLWRGVKKDLSGEFKKGQKLTWWSFNSCTLDCEVLHNELFLGRKSKRTLFNLQTKSAVDIKKYSMYQTEAEILLPPGVRMEVTGVLDQGDLQIVHLNELDGSLQV